MAWRDELSQQLTGKTPEDTEEQLRLFFNFLRISPSYALVDDTRAAKRLTPKTPARTRQLIEVFRLLGEVHTKCFTDWAGPALLLSGNKTSNDQTLLLSHTKPLVIDANCMVFSVPRTLERAQQMAQFRALLDAHDPKPAKRTTGLRPQTLWKALACVYAKARHPDKELWRIGMLANTVERFKGKISPDGPRSLASQADQRRHLTLMVARLIITALLVAENAAIGVFPSMEKDMGPQAEFPFAAHQLHNHLSATGDEEYNLVMKSAGSDFLITS
jgi:hypothetical protein